MADQGEISPGVWERIHYYRRMLFRRDTPWTVKATLLAAIVYLLSPFDLIPDWIGGMGLIDDLTVVSLLVAWAIRMATRQSKENLKKTTVEPGEPG
ncbi:MAG: DUF1232 domain-containing protein [Thermodesulfobacteriota bacterium]